MISESDRPIRVWDQSWVAIVGNTISRNKTGIAVKDQAHAVIISNIVTDNGQDGIWLGGKALVIVQGNLISGHERGVGLAQQITAKILQNRITKNRGWGVLVWIKTCVEQATEDFFDPSNLITTCLAPLPNSGLPG